MLKPAQLYQEQIRQKQLEVMYDMSYQYYNSDIGAHISDLSNDNREYHSFVSVDEKDNVIGLVSYYVYHLAKSADNFGFISFDKGNFIFIKDTAQAIYDIFYKYNLEVLRWSCFADNPALRGYKTFIKNCGGIISGCKRNYMMLMDHKLHDEVEFEVLKDEFDPTYLLRILKRSR